MNRVAIFVDAGYLFAQGSAAIWGIKQPRATLDLNETAAIAELASIAQAKAADATLLRIYWYDGAGFKGPTLEQFRLARLDNIKMRLGFLSSGQQKGVDSLIVTDLIDLARNRAMSDAILLAGDEDLRIGVQIAQSFGVRLHLLGIVPSRGSQSAQLIHEADTTAEWDSTTMTKMLSKRQFAPLTIVASTTAAPTATASTTAHAAIPSSVSTTLDSVTDELISSLSPSDISGIKAYWVAHQRGIPSQFDGKLIATARTQLDRLLNDDEKRHIRNRFSTTVRSKL